MHQLSNHKRPVDQSINSWSTENNRENLIRLINRKHNFLEKYILDFFRKINGYPQCFNCGYFSTCFSSALYKLTFLTPLGSLENFLARMAWSCLLLMGTSTNSCCVLSLSLKRQQNPPYERWERPKTALCPASCQADQECLDTMHTDSTNSPSAAVDIVPVRPWHQHWTPKDSTPVVSARTCCTYWGTLDCPQSTARPLHDSKRRWRAVDRSESPAVHSSSFYCLIEHMTEWCTAFLELGMHPRCL